MAKVAVRRAGGSSLASNLLAYYRANEASGDLLDAVGGLTLTAYNAPDAAAGKLYATARQFTRANSQYFKGGVNALSSLIGPFTVAWWEYPSAYTDVAGQYNDVFANSVVGAFIPGFLIRHTHDGSIVLYLAPGGGVEAWSEHTNALPTLNAWNMSVWTYDPGSGAITYRLNAAAQLDYTWNAAVLGASGEPPILGASLGGTHYYDGRIGPLMVWQRVLTPTERAALYNSGTGLAYEDW